MPNKEIIVNVGERETRIAVTEDGKLVELHIERSERVVGSIYKCRVANVLQGMDAAFVDIGLERNAFLYVGDVLPTGDDTGTSSAPPPAHIPAPTPAPAAASAAPQEPRRGHDRRLRTERRGRQTNIPADPLSAAAGELISQPASEPATEVAAVLDEFNPVADFSDETTAISEAVLPVEYDVDAAQNSDGYEPIEVSAEDPGEPEAELTYTSELISEENEIGHFTSGTDAEANQAAHAAEESELAQSEDDTEDVDYADELEDGDDGEDGEDAEETDGSAPQGDRRPRSAFRKNTKRSVLRQQRIKDVLKVGQERLVQVIKGPRGTKGARVSTRISLPGRYLVLMPEADNLGVSRKIEDSRERDRLKKIGERLREPGFGLIIRTEAEEQTEQELRQDRDFLLQTWREIQEKSRAVRAPFLVQSDLTLLYKTIRDVFGSDVSKLVIDDPAEYEKANDLLDRLSPKLKGRIHLYDGVQPIFDHYKLEEEMSRLLKRKVLMKSGGS